jgi:hypothetical protein
MGVKQVWTSLDDWLLLFLLLAEAGEVAWEAVQARHIFFNRSLLVFFKRAAVEEFKPC